MLVGILSVVSRLFYHVSSSTLAGLVRIDELTSPVDDPSSSFARPSSTNTLISKGMPKPQPRTARRHRRGGQRAIPL